MSFARRGNLLDAGRKRLKAAHAVRKAYWAAWKTRGEDKGLSDLCAENSEACGFIRISSSFLCHAGNCRTCCSFPCLSPAPVGGVRVSVNKEVRSEGERLDWRPAKNKNNKNDQIIIHIAIVVFRCRPSQPFPPVPDVSMSSFFVTIDVAR